MMADMPTSDIGSQSERLDGVSALLRKCADLLAYRRDLAELMHEAAERVALVAEELAEDEGPQT